jgi:hypothetical protein
LETIDWAKLGLDRSKFIGGDQFDCAVPNILYSTVIAYDTDKLNPGPTSIKDLFDLQKFPANAAEKPFVISNGADCRWRRPPTSKVLNTPEGATALKARHHQEGNRRWEAGAQPPQLLADGWSSSRRLERPLTTRSGNPAALQDRGTTGAGLGPVGDPKRAAHESISPINSSLLEPAGQMATRRSTSLWAGQRTPFRKSMPRCCPPTAPDNLKTAERGPAVLGRGARNCASASAPGSTSNAVGCGRRKTRLPHHDWP